MWPFKRRLSMSSPELVSAVAIPLDEVLAVNTIEHCSKENSRAEKVVGWTETNHAASSARKSISTWGRKVSKRLDDRSEILSSKRRHYSPNRVCSNHDSFQNSTFQRPKGITRVKSLRNFFRGDKNCDSNFEDSKNTTIKEESYVDFKSDLSYAEETWIVKSKSFECETPNCSYADFAIDKSLSAGLIAASSSFRNETLNNSKLICSQSTLDIKRQTEQDYFLSNTVTENHLDSSKSSTIKKRNKLESVSDLSMSSSQVPKSSKEKYEKRISSISNGLEELILKLGCDESGYDSDSTRTGADSPDCEKLKRWRSSVISSDSRISDLLPAKQTLTRTKSDSSSDKFRDESVSLPETIKIESDEDLDVTIKAEDNESLEKTLENSPSTLENCNTSFLENSTSSTVTFDLQEAIERTPKKKSSFCLGDGKDKRKKLKKKDDLQLSLLDDTASPCKDTPPQQKMLKPDFSRLIPFTSKRPRKNLEPTFDDPEYKRILKRPAVEPRVYSTEPFFKIEYKAIELKVGPDGLGISIAEKTSASSKFRYVISKIEVDKDADRSGLFRLEDEVVKVNGTCIRGLTLAEAQKELQNCSEQTKIFVVRQPFEWPKQIKGAPKITNEEDVWKPLDRSLNLSCEVIGFHRKDGTVRPVDQFGEEQEVMGMKKFYQKRASTQQTRHSMFLDTITVTLQKGSGRKLGFTIVGGSDSDKGNYGIYVKNVSPNGQAADYLQTEDEILAVNGVPMQGLTHHQALNSIRTVKSGNIVFLVRRKNSTRMKRLRMSHNQSHVTTLTNFRRTWSLDAKS